MGLQRQELVGINIHPSTSKYIPLPEPLRFLLCLTLKGESASLSLSSHSPSGENIINWVHEKNMRAKKKKYRPKQKRQWNATALWFLSNRSHARM